LPDAEKLGLQQSARSIDNGSDHILRCCGLARAILERPLFHELVHVEQYRQLGIPRFSELYVGGFLNGGSYEAIPLEVNAYTLGGRFESEPRRMFSVEDEVGRWAAEGRL